ncbi:MAG: hypothetical protein IPL53_13490 [Ignavibacteria bacterium]|nr:hypothetical protein [Ignavibacteria bacterium]
MKIALTKSDSKFQNYIKWFDRFNVSYDILDHEKHESDLEKINSCSGFAAERRR